MIFDPFHKYQAAKHLNHLKLFYQNYKIRFFLLLYPGIANFNGLNKRFCYYKHLSFPF